MTFAKHFARGLALLCGLSSPGWAGSVTVEPGVDTFDSPHQDSSVGFRNGSVVVVPIPFSNPMLGSGLTLAAGYLFTIDEGSKPSMFGIAALGSNNGSEAYGVAGNLAFDDNRWLMSALYTRANVNYDLYTAVGQLPIRQNGQLARIEFAYGFTPDLSLGASLRYLDTTVDLDGPDLPSIPPPFDAFTRMEIASPGVVLKWDTRDDTIYPTTGFQLKTEYVHSITLNGITGNYGKGSGQYTHYFSPLKNGVVVARGAVCSASSQTPFFDQCALGGADGFRGFPATQFLDFRAASLQIEYRHQLTKRIGGVAFGGVGQTGDRFSTLSQGGTHSAYGLGVRYRVSKKFPVDFSVDWSRNDLDQDNLYIYVGQRF